jgi:hypothetical protein
MNTKETGFCPFNQMLQEKLKVKVVCVNYKLLKQLKNVEFTPKHHFPFFRHLELLFENKSVILFDDLSRDNECLTKRSIKLFLYSKNNDGGDI